MPPTACGPNHRAGCLSDNGGGLVPLEKILSSPVSELKGDDRNIAVLARAYHGVSINAVRNDKGEFVEPVKVELKLGLTGLHPDIAK